MIWHIEASFALRASGIAIVGKACGQMDARIRMSRGKIVRALGGRKPCRITIPLSGLLFVPMAGLWVEWTQPGSR